MKKIIVACFSVVFALVCGCQSGAQVGVSCNSSSANVFVSNIEKDFSVSMLADTHVAIPEKLESPFDDFAKRMFKHGVRDFKIITDSQKTAFAENFSAVILLGDIINYPSPNNVSGLIDCVLNSRISTFYIAGNHDWHFEGDSGSEVQMRAKFLVNALNPIYRGKNPLCYSEKINGVKFVFLDNSTYEISEEQLQVLKAELAENLPTVICAHIPFYLEGGSIFTCANPNWNAQNDPYWKIERRPKWHKDGASKSTFLARDLIFSSSNVLGVFAGHIHKFSADYSQGKFQIILPSRKAFKVNFKKSKQK